MNSENPSQVKFTAAFFGRKAWLAYGIFGFNLLVFALMLKASMFPVLVTFRVGNDPASLINFGAKTNFWLLQQQQWFRLVTPIFLHIGLLHLAANSYALWQIGPIAERLYGPARFAVMYLLTGIAGVVGSLLSVQYSKMDGPSAGSSGALFGLFGVLVVFSYKYRHELPPAFRREFRKNIITVVVVNLAFGFMNNFSNSSGRPMTMHFIDNGAHLAGLLTGAILAMILPWLAPEKKPNSRWGKIILVICLLIVSYCFWRAYQLRPFQIVR